MTNEDQNDQSSNVRRPRRNRTLTIAAIALTVIVVVFFWRSPGSSIPSVPDTPSKWKSFVSVEGQPDKVPAEWVATPEGQFAHSIKLPDPLPADSGYREGMTGKEYWEHLCQTQAGEFIYGTVDNVEGFYFMRPPNRPTDDDLKDRYILEAPELERVYRFPSTPEERSKTFVNPPWATYTFVEEIGMAGEAGKSYLRMLGYDYTRKSAMKRIDVATLRSHYGLVWRGIKRKFDRELGIAGSEWIIISLDANDVLAVQRTFTLSGDVRNAPDGIWWLSSRGCPNVHVKGLDRTRYYDFVTSVLKPLVLERKP